MNTELRQELVKAVYICDTVEDFDKLLKLFTEAGYRKFSWMDDMVEVQKIVRRSVIIGAIGATDSFGFLSSSNRKPVIHTGELFK